MKLGRGVSVEGRTGGERTYRWPTVPVAPRMPTLIWGRGDMGADWGEMNASGGTNGVNFKGACIYFRATRFILFIYSPQ